MRIISLGKSTHTFKGANHFRAHRPPETPINPRFKSPFPKVYIETAIPRVLCDNVSFQNVALDLF